jgi:DnaJ-class molecular chaperone
MLLSSESKSWENSKSRWMRFGLLVVLILVSYKIVVVDGSMNDPYAILGVTRNATQKEIQKKYKQLCLKYHPDKNVHRSDKERRKFEERFKAVSEAYQRIGTPAARRQQQAQTAASGGPYGTDPVAEAFYRAFDMNGRTSSSAFFFRPGNFGTGQGPTFGMRRPFPDSSTTSSSMPAELSFKSIYIQKVQIPLQKLYKGGTIQLELKDNIWTRYRAAWRGKILFLSFYQGLIYSAPILRANKFCAAVVGLFIIHSTLPRPDPDRQYKATFKRGTKGGKTNVKFTSIKYGDPEVIFEIEEDSHPVYRRQDNDLLTEITISTQEAEEGCLKRISALDSSEPPIEVVIPPNTYSYQKQKIEDRRKNTKEHGGPKNNQDDDHNDYPRMYDNTIRIRNRGWPIRQAIDEYGDVLVTVNVQKPSRNRRSKLKHTKN